MSEISRKASYEDRVDENEEIKSDELSSEIELKREKTELFLTEDTSGNDIEGKSPQSSITVDVGETVDEKPNIGVSDGESRDPLELASNENENENKSRRTSMRKCKVQALQKRKESIKRKAEDKLLGKDIIDGFSFSSDDDDGEQLDDSDQDPVWTPAEKAKDLKIEQRKGNVWKHRRKSVTTPEKTLQQKSNFPDAMILEASSDRVMVESSHLQQPCEEISKCRFSSPSQNKLLSETESRCQEQELPIIKEAIETEKENFLRKRKSITSYKYTQSSHIIEGHFKTGNFVMAVVDKDKPSPPIWRIEGKSLLQRFEAFNDNGRLLYRNASSYSAWNSTTVYKYIGINVLLVSHNRNSSVVENLGPITDEEKVEVSQAGQGPQVWLLNCPNQDADEERRTIETATQPRQEAFEVFLQTLLSHVLDPSFIIEIIKENDDYFLSHLNLIAETTEEKKKKIFENNELSEQLKNMVEALPSINVLPNSDAIGQMCDVCSVTKGQHVIHCVGQPYDPTSLICKKLSEQTFPVNNKAPVCATCAHAVVLYSHMHHHKYNFFLKCKKKVNDVRSFKQNKEESHMLLEECLQDTVWVNQMFQEIKDMWSASDNLR